MNTTTVTDSLNQIRIGTDRIIQSTMRIGSRRRHIERSPMDEVREIHEDDQKVMSALLDRVASLQETNNLLKNELESEWLTIQEYSRLRQWTLQYGRHKIGCAWTPNVECTCGWKKALEEIWKLKRV